MSKPNRKSPSRGLLPPVTRERRQSAGTPGSLAWLKSLLGRPLRLVRRNGKLHLVLVDRRRPRDVLEAAAAAEIAEELRVRLLAHPSEGTAAAMRHVTLVHDMLVHQGWDAVQMLPAAVLGQAAVQARVLVTEAPSRRLAWFIEQLQTARVAAQVREEKAAAARAATAGD